MGTRPAVRRPLHSVAAWLRAAPLACALAGASAEAGKPPVLVGEQEDGSYVVPTAQRLTPAGTHVEVRDRPLGMALSPAGDLLAVVTGSNFNPRALHLIDRASRTVKQSIALGNSFVGVDFSPAGDRLYVGGGSDNNVKIFTRGNGGTFAADGVIALPGGSPSGLQVSPDGRRLYVALNLANQVAVIDTASRAVLARIPVGTYPYTVVVSADGAKAYVSNWGGRIPGKGDVTDGQNPVVVDVRTGIPSTGTVSVIDTATRTVLGSIDVGLHPSGLASSPDGKRVYVTNANSDTVSVIDTATDRVTRTLRVGLRGENGNPVLGSAPNAVVAAGNGRTLYVANGAQNAIAVVDAEAGGDDPVLGFIPTGWYPTAVALGHHGRELIIASGYGFGSIAPAASGGSGRSYADRAGVVSFVGVPRGRELARLTRQVLANNVRLPAVPGEGEGEDEGGGGGERREREEREREGRGHLVSPVPMHLGDPSPIKHVFYIIKENRTYDQVFGDLGQGNGDPSLVEFGRDVSPNHHALVEQFVLLDNYYGPGDQSALGHRWCLQAFPSDWVWKYSNARNNQNPMLLGPTDAIYDKAKARGLTVRAYGERGANVFNPPGATWSDFYADWKNGTHKVTLSAAPVILGLRDIYHPRYSAAESRVPDVYRADIFLEEFSRFEQEGNLPSLVLLLLYNDHTAGTSPGFPTPRAQVADNDLALGRIVDRISHSRYWGQSAIFVTEDDSQDGLDHVDGHRTVGLVISPYTRHGAVDSTLYTIVNMFRTIEQILGLAPENQFDLAAEPMFSVFTARPDLTPYRALPNNIPLDEMNPQLGGLLGRQRALAEFSLTIDTSEPDSAPADLLNRAIWHSVKGWDTPYNHGRPRPHQHPDFLSLVNLASARPTP